MITQTDGSCTQCGREAGQCNHDRAPKHTPTADEEYALAEYLAGQRLAAAAPELLAALERAVAHATMDNGYAVWVAEAREAIAKAVRS
jgi:hypothetical protein